MSKTSVIPNLLRMDLYSFIAKAFKFSEGQSLEPSSRYIEYLCYIIMQFVDGRTKRLLINLPGRHLKTFICSICLPAFILGRDPTRRLMIVAYDKSLAEDIVRQIRDIMDSPWYKKVFKGTRISSGHSLKSDFTVIGGGRVRAVPIRSVTGKGGNIIIFDDPHNVHDWNSPPKKESVIGAFSTLMTRRNSGVNTQILVVGHRVAEDDLSAHIIERRDFKHLCLPLFAPQNMEFEMGDDTFYLAKGKSLRPDAFPPDEIEIIRREHRGSPFWLHQQQGIGTQKDDFQIGVEHFPIIRCRFEGLPVVISVDAALKTESGSQNVVHVYAIKDNQYILLQAFAEKCSFKTLRVKIEKFIRVYCASVVLVENTARGPDLIDALREKTSVEIVAINPEGRKLDRLQACLHVIQAKRVCIKEGRREAENAIDQVVAFPNCPNDDHVDTMTNFLLWITGRRSPLQPPKLPFLRSEVAIARAPRPASAMPLSVGRPSLISSTPGLIYTALGPVIIRR